MSYIGYFRSLYKDILYSVNIRKVGDTSTPTEIILAGEQPFVVKYDESATPFEPIRNSTATIKIVSTHYFEDVLPSKAQETEVILRNETSGKDVWIGYLTPKIYSQGYQDEIETIELEASDVISSLQYMDYITDEKNIISFKDIIIKLIDNTNLKGFYWGATKYNYTIPITPEQLRISEQNFFSSDTDESWNCQEVLEEMCRYLGYTAMQYEDSLYFVDYTALNNSDRFEFYSYPKSLNYSKGNSKWSGNKVVVSEPDIMGNGESITFEPVYNKIIVKDSFYTCENFIRNIFDDEGLTNRGDDFYSSFEVMPIEEKPSYPDGSKWFHQKYVDDADDTKYRYFHRLYDHEDYESVYRNTNLTQVFPTNINNSSITKNYVGATIVDLGRVEKDYMDENYQNIVANQIEWNRYLCINQMGKGWIGYSEYAPTTPQENMIVYKLKDNYNSKVLLDSANSYLIINYGLIFEKYQKRNYINPDWSTDGIDQSSWESGQSISTPGNIAIKLGIGGKYWNGKQWVSYSTYFYVPNVVESKDKYAYINEERKVLNNVSWELNIDEEGYKIPLNGVDTSGKIDFAIYLPKLQLITDFDGLNDTEYNGYCWVKDFSIKTTTSGQDMETEDADVVYENVIDDTNVSEMSEISLKFTTSVANTKPSYSNVILNLGSGNKFLETIEEIGLGNVAQKPEENIIEKYYNQYSTPTKKLSYVLDNSYTPFDKYYGMDVYNTNTGYVQMSADIDFSRDKQEIILLEKK